MAKSTRQLRNGKGDEMSILRACTDGNLDHLKALLVNDRSLLLAMSQLAVDCAAGAGRPKVSV